MGTFYDKSKDAAKTLSQLMLVGSILAGSAVHLEAEGDESALPPGILTQFELPHLDPPVYRTQTTAYSIFVQDATGTVIPRNALPSESV